MTMPIERTRAIVCAGAFLIELARDERLPRDIRQTAVSVARHFPTTSDLWQLAIPELTKVFGDPPLVVPSREDMQEWLRDFPQGALHSTTYLTYPEESQEP